MTKAKGAGLVKRFAPELHTHESSTGKGILYTDFVDAMCKMEEKWEENNLEGCEAILRLIKNRSDAEAKVARLERELTAAFDNRREGE